MASETKSAINAFCKCLLEDHNLKEAEERLEKLNDEGINKDEWRARIATYYILFLENKEGFARVFARIKEGFYKDIALQARVESRLKGGKFPEALEDIKKISSQIMKDYAIIWAVDSVSYESYLPLKEIVKKKVSEDMQDRAFEALFKGCIRSGGRKEAINALGCIKGAKIRERLSGGLNLKERGETSSDRKKPKLEEKEE